MKTERDLIKEKEHEIRNMKEKEQIATKRESDFIMKGITLSQRLQLVEAYLREQDLIKDHPELAEILSGRRDNI